MNLLKTVAPTKKSSNEVVITNPNFRPNTTTQIRPVIFKFTLKDNYHCALGDAICWLPAIEYVAENFNYVQGNLIIPEWLHEIAKNILSKYPHWRVYDKVPSHLSQGIQLREQIMDPVNATMMHLVDLGFLYFAGQQPTPEEYNRYPLLDLENVPIPGPKLPDNYAVVIPGAQAANRKFLPHQLNGISDHLISKGITPVYLGTQTMNHGTRKIDIDDRYDLSKGVNLIGQTYLLDAAKIMEKARMVIGIDNGLLHLAGMTDATILYGYTIAGPKHRQIRRRYGHTVELYGSKEKLPCLFCQENMRFFLGHHFTECMYKEYEPSCVKELNLQSWIATIDQVLNE